MGSNNSTKNPDKTDQLAEYTEKKKNEREALDILSTCLRMYSTKPPTEMKVFFNDKLYNYICKYGCDDKLFSNIPFRDSDMTFFSG